MTIAERLWAMAAALPSDGSSITLTRSDLVTLLEGEKEASLPVRDLTVEEVAQETGRAPSTVRGWLIRGELQGYKLNGRDWRVPRPALRAYLEGQATPESDDEPEGDVDLGAWRRLRGVAP